MLSEVLKECETVLRHRDMFYSGALCAELQCAFEEISRTTRRSSAAHDGVSSSRNGILGFSRVIVLDAKRAVSPAGIFDFDVFIEVIARAIVEALGFDLDTRNLHREQLSQLLKDERNILFGFFSLDHLTEGHYRQLRGLGFTQTDHRILFCGRSEFLRSRSSSVAESLGSGPTFSQRRALQFESEEPLPVEVLRERERNGSARLRMSPPPDVCSIFPGISPLAIAVRKQLHTLIAAIGHVFIRGETGTGKERVARSMNQADSKGMFIRQNCAELTRDLARSRFLGYPRGAINGTRHIKAGLLAPEGVLFLDEVCELSDDVQADLLRFLENDSYLAIGAHTLMFRRIVVATKIDLDKAVASGQFRHDLLARLRAASAPLELPPLRERREDILPCAQQFLFEALSRAPTDVWTPRAAECLVGYDWPQNLHELREVVQTLATESRSFPIDYLDLPEKIATHWKTLHKPAPPAVAATWSIDRATLLPRSGVGVVGSWLVISKPGNPAIRVDLRALDKIAVADSEIAARNRDQDWRSDLILACGDLEVAIHIADGPDAVERTVQEAAPFTRGTTGSDTPADLSRILFVGNDAVMERGDYIQVGGVAFRINEVREYALRGANLPLAGGRLLQAAMALLVVAAAERDAATATSNRR